MKHPNPIRRKFTELNLVLYLAPFILLSLLGSASGIFIRNQNPEPLTVGSNATSKAFQRDLLNDSYSYREARRSVVSGGIFSIIAFENVPCSATNGDIGVCFSQRECTNLGGTTAGLCAGNYGVCCSITETCGATVSQNNTYFVNPAYPSTTTGPLSCSITVNKLAGASQLYLEFISFDILGPTQGACTNDSFVVTVMGQTSSSSYPVLCGMNTGQMEYINLGQASGPVTLTITLSNNAYGRSWKIRIVQFKPTDFCAAPSGCNQYYRDLSGNITSYNYNNGMGQVLNNFCINICFQNHPGYCNILLTENTFMLAGTAPSTCVSEYILINGVRFCGDTLNNGMVQVNQTIPGSFISITYCSQRTHPDMDVGFNIRYTFLPCVVVG